MERGKRGPDARKSSCLPVAIAAVRARGRFYGNSHEFCSRLWRRPTPLGPSVTAAAAAAPAVACAGCLQPGVAPWLQLPAHDRDALPCALEPAAPGLCASSRTASRPSC